jgi:DNA-binding NtrC family response regulator
MSSSVKIVDPQFRLVYVNQTAQNNLKRDLNDLRGRFCHEAFFGIKEKCFHCGMEKIFKNGAPFEDYFTMTVNGINRDYQVSAFPLASEDKKNNYGVEIIRDVTSVLKSKGLPQNAGRLSSRDKSFDVVFNTMAQWADDDRAVLVQGEEGTGKRSFARALHQRSARSEGPFRFFHCADNPLGECCDGLFGPDGAWEKARGGTLYLDGICHMGAKTQLLLVEKISKPVDGQTPRVIAATTKNIVELVQDGSIRPELYSQLASRVLRLPPLRDRKQDLPFLAQNIIDAYKVGNDSPAEKLSPSALSQLMTYDWPENIRELENQIERACLLATSSFIEKLDLPVAPPPQEHKKLEDFLSETEKTYLVDALTKTEGRLAKTAKLAGLTQKTLQRKMKKYGLKTENFKHISNGFSNSK